MKTPYFSYATKELPRGCQLCVKGQKLVMFVTGLCPRSCVYCPISENRMKKDVVFANEWPITPEQTDIIIKEARLCEAKGAGFTGGDPLAKLDRTIRYIKLLKKEFGERFHIHLYSPLIPIQREHLKRLYDVGLDEIRFHPDIDDKKHWHHISAADFDWDMGIEIPVFPDKLRQTIEIFEFFKNKVKFFNLNELELSDTNEECMAQLGYNAKSDISHAVAGCDNVAFEIMERYPNLVIHYCTSRLKNGVQLANRIKRRARNVKLHFDKVTDEGLIIHGVIYHPLLCPGVGYNKKVREYKDKEKIITELKTELKRLKIDGVVDEFKPRILFRQGIALKIAKKTKYRAAIVEEYPTYDRLEVSVEFLN